MPDSIPLWPDVSEELRLAARRGTLIPFVGAGLSRLAGCPSWDELAQRALASFVDGRTMSHGHLDQLSRLSPRVKLSLACALEDETHREIDFRALLRPREDGRSVWERAHRFLSELGTTFVTTNYDELLDVLPPPPSPPIGASSNAPVTSTGPTARQVLYEASDFHEAHLRTANTVIHIHGSVCERRSMVLTPSDYLQRYSGHRLNRGASGENPYLSFLEMLFEMKNVLFIGYGLEELEILEYVFQKARARGTPEIRHFMVQGFFNHEHDVMRSLRDYYKREFNIGLLPFSREEEDWLQLVNVLEKLASELRSGPLLASQAYREMEGLLE